MKRIAIIGLGAVTRNIHLPAYAQLADSVTVVGGCDVDSEARALVAQKGRIPAVFEQPEEMIEKTKPDIVTICTPPFLHHKQALMALQHGCHVFCEKPFAEDLTQADEIIWAATKWKKLVVINHQFPYMNIHATAKEMIGTPEFGRLLFLHAWQTFRPTEATEASWRGEMQRRLCFEFGVHVFSLVRYFFEDTPAKIFAHMPRPDASLKSDAINVITMEFSDGRAASVLLDRLSKGAERYLDMRLDGEFSTISTSIGGEVSLSLGMHTRERQPFANFTVVKGGKATLQNGNRSRVIAKDGINPFASATAVHLRNFSAALESGQTPPGEASDNRKTLALALAAYDSAETGAMVDMKSYLQPAAP